MSQEKPHAPSSQRQTIIPAGVILAGGQSRRMSGLEGRSEKDKFLMPANGSTLLGETVKRLSAQLNTIIISTNSDHKTISSHLPDLNNTEISLISDDVKGFAGPLAGIHAAMKWLKETKPEVTHILSIAADTPFFPANLTARFLEAANTHQDGTIFLAQSADQVHPVFGLWPMSIFGNLETALGNGVRKIRQFTDQHPLQTLTFQEIIIKGEAIDPFFNINKPEDWQKFLKYQSLIIHRD